MKKIDKSNYDNIVYISHPYQGKQENIDDIENIIKELRKEYPNCLFISSVHSFGWLYDCTSYQEGLEMTLFLLETCVDEMWVFGDWQNSTGVQAEIAYCEEYSIPYKIFFNKGDQL